MGGIGSGGHNRKSTEQLKHDGGYDASRHKDRIEAQDGFAEQLVRPEELVPPADMTLEAKAVWAQLISTIPNEALHQSDSLSLRIFCDLMVVYGGISRLMQSDPLDKDVRLSYMQCVTQLDKLGRQFGWSPLSRSGLKVVRRDEEDSDPMQSLINSMTSGGKDELTVSYADYAENSPAS